MHITTNSQHIAMVWRQEPGTNAEVKADVFKTRGCRVCASDAFWELCGLRRQAFAQSKCPDTFPLFAKIDVNGENEAAELRRAEEFSQFSSPSQAPLYTFLKNRKGEMLPSERCFV